ncbi:hypothetical protein Pla175_18540 [Pirellulimonas nuda]|uniref:Prenyltransferase and squalene oxidase repeat protein n=1 Tax=Pirellulimonas nuda TaxID=2528009 RepID=A0A518DAM7_9BACT|nr:hypothetical protein [Pirellulimonas nuda]QDU88476.1 hypothetical protein Pla175_18540 [Pirellulimonas nuda]
MPALLDQRRITPEPSAPPPLLTAADPGQDSPRHGRRAAYLLAMWSGMSAGVVLALGGFDQPDPLRNGFVRLGVLAAIVVLLVWTIGMRRAWLARRLQFAVALSLLAHTALVVALAVFDLTVLADALRAAAVPAAVETPAPKEPDRVEVDLTHADEQADFERPLAIGAAQLATLEPSRERSAPKEVADIAPPEAPIDATQKLPHTIALPRPESAAPRLAENPGQRAHMRDTAPGVATTPTRDRAAPPRVEPRPAPAVETARDFTPPVPVAATPLPSLEDLPIAAAAPVVASTPAPQRRPATAETAAASPAPPQPMQRIPVVSPAAPPEAARRQRVAELPRIEPTLRAEQTPMPLAERSFEGPSIMLPSRRAPQQRDTPLAVLEQAQPIAASGAAARERPVQPRPGPAPAPNAAARSGWSRADDQRAASALLARLIDNPDAAGQEDPTRNQSASAASESRSAQRALTERSAADAGDGQVDAAPGPNVSPAAPRRSTVSGGAAAAAQLAAAAPVVGSPEAALPAPGRADAGPSVAAPVARAASGAMVDSAALLGAVAGQSESPAPSAVGAAPGGDRPLLASAARQAPTVSRGGLSMVGPMAAAMPLPAPAPASSLGPRAPSPGMLRRPALDVGVDALAARADSSAVHATADRLRSELAGGQPTIAGRQRRAAAAFSSRGDRNEPLPSGAAGGPTPRTEAAIELGLDFLTRLQQPDGRWTFHDLGSAPIPADEAAQARADSAATGLALLSFLGAGYDHFEGPRRDVVDRGIKYLLTTQQPSGLVFAEAEDANPWQVAQFYSHGIASLALCEAFGMTGDPELRGPAQRALDYTERTQVAGLGGWRYTPGLNADLSVTGWQLMALRSGELAGLKVDRNTYRGVRSFLERCREPGGERCRFCYNPLASPGDPVTAHGRNPGTVMTSVGLLCQLYLGENRESPRMQRGADHLLKNLPTPGAGGRIAATSTPDNPLRDTYYWYYATQVMFHMRGEHWRAWNDALHPLLLDSQSQSGELAGSWNPRSPAPDKWASFGGRLYVTAMNLLSLEVHYRHLPLYAMTAE